MPWFVLFCLVLPFGSQAEESIPYRVIPVDTDEVEPYVEVTAGVTAEQELPLVEVAPDRFSGGSRHGRTVYQEMDYDDLDSEAMVEVRPAKKAGRAPAPPTVVPVREGEAFETAVVPAERVIPPRPRGEDRIFRQAHGVPPAPGGSSQVPGQARIYIPPALAPDR